MKRLGAKIKNKNGYIHASTSSGLKSASIKFPKISVGATENAILSAVNAKGETKLQNCAIEPEIIDLIKFLKNMGVKISLRNRVIKINGVTKFKKVKHRVIFDRIELGTYLIAGAIVL